MLVFIRPVGPLEIGESWSGARALFIPYSKESSWPFVERNPVFRCLTAEEQETVRQKFPLAVRRYQALFGAGCKWVPGSPPLVATLRRGNFPTR